MPAKPGLLPPAASPFLLPTMDTFPAFSVLSHKSSSLERRGGRGGGGTDSGMALDLPWEWGSTCDSRDRRRILREESSVFLSADGVCGWEVRKMGYSHWNFYCWIERLSRLDLFAHWILTLGIFSNQE